jgi:hypothetical protein
METRSGFARLSISIGRLALYTEAADWYDDPTLSDDWSIQNGHVNRLHLLEFLCLQVPPVRLEEGGDGVDDYLGLGGLGCLRDP